MAWTTAIIVGSAVAIVGGYTYWQYRSAHPPELGSLPVYFVQAEVSVADIPEPHRTDGEQQLRNLAASTQGGYRVADERFLATRGPLIWDAMRHRFGPDLESAGYVLDRNGSSADHVIAYSLYRHDGWLRSRLNKEMILVAGFDHPSGTVDEVHLYGYFKLAPRLS